MNRRGTVCRSYVRRKTSRPTHPGCFSRSNGSADGWLYEDEGEGFAYKYGRYKITTFAAKRLGKNLLLMSPDSIGLLPDRPRALEVKVLTDNGTQTFQIPAPARFPIWLRLEDEKVPIGGADRSGAFSAN